MTRLEIFAQIDEEREYQQEKFGHLDETNTAYNWAAYISHYATRHLIGDPKLVSEEEFKKDMIKVASLAVAALEAE